ncbi:hypothetical protein [Pseudoalteromonas sp. 68 DY56-GL68]|uniref:hypothetical protein n=1 Tax=Pseudoalteromonas sp. 68 DY56-GL68 TaxID=2974919 RepID=UPI00352A3997
MRVKLRENKVSKIIRTDAAYNVYAVYISEKKTEFMVMTELHSFPMAIDRSDVDIIDNRISGAWVYGSDNGSSKNVILSFPEWANDSYFYQNLVESNGDAGSIFRAYQHELEMEFADSDISISAVILQDSWIQCPKCGEAWELNKGGEAIECPKCDSKLLNPFV